MLVTFLYMKSVLIFEIKTVQKKLMILFFTVIYEQNKITYNVYEII